jgi:hypothetical protein
MSVIAYKKTPLAHGNTKWDAGEEVKRASVDDLKIMCTYFDDDGSKKGDYHLPHHLGDGEHACVWDGVAAAAAAVQGARGASIPADVLDGVRKHLAGHYKDFDKGEPPWEAKENKSSPHDYELRYFPFTELRVTKDAATKTAKLNGYAAVFNQLSEDLGGFREKIDPGAFARTIKTDDIRALFNHDPNHVLGRSTAGTLRLKEDGKGLNFECDLPDTQCARDLQVSIERGDISQCSFGFITNADNWENNADGSVTRTLRDVSCRDVSPVTFPAYPQTSVKARDYISALKESAELRNKDARGTAPQEGYAVSLDILKRKLDLANL